MVPPCLTIAELNHAWTKQGSCVIEGKQSCWWGRAGRWTPAPFAGRYVAGTVTVVSDDSVDWKSAGNVETNYIQHVAENKGSKLNIGLSSNYCGQVFIQTFAYLELGRIKATLDAGQPKEQHGFRADGRIEQHLLTTNLVLDKALSLHVPMWIVSLHLSKAFDTGKWKKLMETLSEHGVTWLDFAPACLSAAHSGGAGCETNTSVQSFQNKRNEIIQIMLP